MLDHAGYVAVCYAVGLFIVVSFAAYAVAYGAWFQKRQKKIQDTESFLTARGTQSLWRIGWSFFCGAVGAWAVVTPATFAGDVGIVGVVAYASATGIPILMIAFFGERITAGMPHVFSLADFVGWRFGPVLKTAVALIALFNMCIVLLAEYTTIGSIFTDYVGSVGWGIILAVAVVTMCYTAYGGLVVSIATDQVQGVASCLLLVAVSGYVGATYRGTPVPKPIPDYLGPTKDGWLSFFTLGASLAASTMFSEAMWQRVWASEDRRTLRGGAVIGVVLTTLLIFIIGFGGWLALLWGLAVPGETNRNLYFFQLFGSGYVQNWVGVLVVLLALCMNEGAVDSLQNGIASSLGGHFFKNAPLWWNRIGVIALNIPLMVLAMRGYDVLSLFLVTNLLCSCAVIPVALGLIKAPGANEFFTETGALFGMVCGVVGLTAFGIGLKWDPSDVAGSFSAGADWSWYSNIYDWRAFLMALCLSTAGDLLWCTTGWALRRFLGFEGLGVSDILMRIPGMSIITASPDWSRQTQPKGWSEAPGGGADAKQAAGNDSKDPHSIP